MIPVLNLSETAEHLLVPAWALLLLAKVMIFHSAVDTREKMWALPARSHPW